VIEAGMAMYLVDRDSMPRNPHDEFYAFDKLPDRYKKYTTISIDVLKLRNLMIVLSALEIFASMWGFSYYFIRKVIYFFMCNFISSLLSMLL
jgi:hypothetical protein